MSAHHIADYAERHIDFRQIRNFSDFKRWAMQHEEDLAGLALAGGVYGGAYGAGQKAGGFLSEKLLQEVWELILRRKK